MIELSESQMMRYESIKWLLGDGPRRSGRSFLMAVIFVEKAVSDLGHVISVHDHYTHNRQNMFCLIDIVFNKMEMRFDVEGNTEFILDINRMDNRIRINPNKKFGLKGFKKISIIPGTSCIAVKSGL